MKKIIALLTLFIPLTFHAQDKIPVQNLQSDAQLLWQAVNELHPGIYRHSDTSELRVAYNDLREQFSNDRSQKQAFLYLSEFVTKIRCGHTHLNPYNQPNKIIHSIISDAVLLPFTFRIIDRKIVVDRSFTPGVAHYDVIKCINDIKVGEILDSLSQYIKSDGFRQTKKIKDLEVSLDVKYNYFDYYFALVYKFSDAVSVAFEDGTILDVPLITVQERNNSKAETENSYDHLWSYTYEDNYAYLKLGTFVTWKITFDWEDYLDIFFEELDERNIESLIIDIRGNEGGLSEVADYIIQQLAYKEGMVVPRRKHLAYKKVSANLKPHLNTWNKWFYNIGLWTRKLDDSYRTPRFSRLKRKIKRNKNPYTGKTYLMIDESNSSATFYLAENCKANNYATLIGTETGGTQKGITAGQIFFMTLPNTKIEVDIPLIGYYPEMNLPDEGIKPDISVPVNLADFISGKDNQLTYTLQLIE